jgi:hypothetical protein
MKKKIMIIGAGWMGCHLAYILNSLGHKIVLFEKNNIFSGMSGSNTNRLHMGYHYPRNHQTRTQSKNGYQKFIKKYPNLIKGIKNNLIYIVKKNSLIDFKTYKKIMSSSGLKTNISNYFKKELINVDGLIKVNEQLILQEKAKNFFKKKLKKFLVLNKKINMHELKYQNKNLYYHNENFDFAIDCTAANLSKHKVFDVSYEPRITFVYKSKIKNFALMAMDGLFFNIFPYSNGMYSLGTPKYSKFKKFNNSSRAKDFLAKINIKEINKRKNNSEKIVKETFKKFNEYFKYQKYYFSLTTIFNSKSDNRPTLIKKNKKIISVLGGKIDTIFEAEKQIIKLIK